MSAGSLSAAIWRGSQEVLASGEIGAAIVEPIVGREGVLIPPAGWLSGLAEICRKHGALLIADEIFTGFGRTGTLFAVEHEGVRPDILCCGKALGGGLPIAAVIARRDLFRCWETPRRGAPHRHLPRQSARLRRRPSRAGCPAG